nr:cytokinin riboside 5'-monophosphate phosphoribohydrolase-like [Nerophis lumbriciformis]
MSRFKRICVFCGSQEGNDPVYTENAIAIGQKIAERDVGLVFGGGKVGLMGKVANAVLIKGGEAIGVIPDKLMRREVAHQGLTELFVVESMHARKAMMAHLAGAFIALPGGWGTMEEMFEILTWTQLRYHLKPIGMLNVNGYYDSLLTFADHMVAEGFLRPEHRSLLIAETDPDALLDRLEATIIPDDTRWIDKV